MRDLGPAICREAMGDVGAGIGASLRAVDCAAGEMAQAAFNRLFSAEGSFGPVLTILLTLWIAFLGFGFITGRTRIGLSSLTPKMVTLVLVITFATSWIAFQSVFWNLAVGAPDQIGRVLMGTDGSATTIFADKLDVVLLSLMQVSGGDAMDANTSIFSPPGLLWSGATMLLLGTVGLLATCKIALAVLMALGPIFIVMALFKGTQGLFAGWLKAVVLMAIAPLFAVLAGSLMLELSTPVLASLSTVPGGEIDVRPAMAFFMIGAVHLALMFMVMKTATTMVAGWSVFGMASKGEKADEARSAALAPGRAPSAMLTETSARERGAGQTGSSPAPARDIRVATTPMAANDTGGGTNTVRTTKIVTGPSASSGGTDGQTKAVSRARGIGSRFKSAPQRTEKM